MKIKLQNNFWLVQQFKKNPHKIFIKTNGKQFSYSQIFKLSKLTSLFFIQKGIKSEDHVSIISQNNLEFVIVINALWFIGAIPILINNRLKENEIKNLIIHSDSQFLITIGKHFNKLFKEEKSTINFEINKLKSKNNFRDFVRFNVSKTAVMIYSSGSTGNPKLVELTYKNLYSSFYSSNKFIKHKETDIWLASLPFFHIGGFSIITRAILSGAVLAIPTSLKENELVNSIKKYKPSLISLVPAMLKKMLDKEINVWKNLRIIFIGGGPTVQNLISESIQKGFPICNVYGSTETSSMVTFAEINNLKENGISAGVTFPNVELKIIGKNGRKIKDGNIGEIVIISDSVALSYYKNQKNNNLRTGKYFTNDHGKIDEKGNLHIIGRKDDIIISGGENISLNEIRNVIQNNYVDSFETIKIVDEKWGESYILIFERISSEKFKNGVNQILRNNLASYKLPKEILFVKKFPRTALGKIKKAELTQNLKLNAA